MDDSDPGLGSSPDHLPPAHNPGQPRNINGLGCHEQGPQREGNTGTQDAG
jgi:hypothetical protein